MESAKRDAGEEEKTAVQLHLGQEAFCGRDGEERRPTDRPFGEKGEGESEIEHPPPTSLRRGARVREQRRLSRSRNNS